MAKYILTQLFDKDYPVTQAYGVNPDYYKQFGLPGHEGVDYGTPNGTPILSPFDGVILRDTFNDKDYGNFTVVWDSKQLCAVWFCHLQDVTTTIGQQVKKGDLLGHTDNTGNTTGPHCHVNFVETDANGNRLNKDNGYQGFLNILDTNLVSFSNTPITVPNDLQQQLDQARKDRDENWKSFTEVCTALNVQANPADKPGSVTSALAAIKSFSDQLQGLQKAVNDRDETISQLKVQIEQVNVSNASIADLYKKKCEEDETTSALGRQAESNLKEVTADIESTAQALDTTYPDIKNLLTAVDSLKTQVETEKKANEQIVKQSQNFFEMLLNIFWKKKK